MTIKPSQTEPKEQQLGVSWNISKSETISEKSVLRICKNEFATSCPSWGSTFLWNYFIWLCRYLNLITFLAVRILIFSRYWDPLVSRIPISFLVHNGLFLSFWKHRNMRLVCHRSVPGPQPLKWRCHTHIPFVDCQLDGLCCTQYDDRKSVLCTSLPACWLISQVLWSLCHRAPPCFFHPNSRTLFPFQLPWSHWCWGWTVGHLASL